MTARDFRAQLAGDRCWDREVETIFQERGEGLADCIQQNREEVVALCELIERAGIRSYLEIGVWTGRLLCALHRIFHFDLVAACDQGWAEANGFAIHLPPETVLFRGNSESAAYRAWRESLGHIDLGLIDAKHRRHAGQRDFVRKRTDPHRGLAFHDICGARPATRGVGDFWRDLRGGRKLEIIRPHHELGLDHSLMGIGIWSATEAPPAEG